MSEFCRTFAVAKVKTTKLTDMEAVLRQPLYTIDELDASLKSIIYKERLIESNWKEQPMRPWSEVYDELCSEVGHAYGLNDIREA